MSFATTAQRPTVVADFYRGNAARAMAISTTAAYPAVNPSPPTITWGTASVLTTKNVAAYKSAQFSLPGTLVSYGPNYVGAASGNGTPNGMTVAFEYTGSKVSIVLRSSVTNGASFRLLLDGQPTNLRAQPFGISASAGALVWLTLDWGGVTGPHRVELDVYLASLYQIEFGPIDSLAPIVRNKRRIGIIGDSFAGGANTANDGVSALEAYPYHVSRLLNVEVFNGGQGGTGYANNGKGNVSGNEVFGHSSRLDPMIAAGLDELWFWGSVNDANSTYAASAYSGALAAYKYVAQNAPTLPVYVFGVQPSTAAVGANSGNWAYHSQAMAGIMQAVSESPNVRALIDLEGTGGVTLSPWAFNTAYNVGDRFTFAGSVWQVNVAHTSAGSGAPNQGSCHTISTFTGSGYSAGLTNDGNRDIMLSSDTVHPTWAGARELGIATVRGYLNAQAR